MRDFSFADIPASIIDGQRYYETPNGPYPSVTTVLSVESKDGIEKWKKRIGEAKAEFLKKRAADRGTIIHEMMETHLKGGKVSAISTLPFYYSMFAPLRDHMDRNMKELWTVEAPLYSDRLKVAGRTDCVALFDEPEIVDFKGTTTPKKEEYISGYKMQACAYAFMFEERTGIKIPRYRILVVDESGELQVFKGNTTDNILDFAKVRQKFKEQFGK